jgi:hypothetical protein
MLSSSLLHRTVNEAALVNINENTSAATHGLHTERAGTDDAAEEIPVCAWHKFDTAVSAGSSGKQPGKKPEQGGPELSRLGGPRGLSALAPVNSCKSRRP